MLARSPLLLASLLQPNQQLRTSLLVALQPTDASIGMQDGSMPLIDVRLEGEYRLDGRACI
jgi:hypothetical protein